jgi:hypothetical protein
MKTFKNIVAVVLILFGTITIIQMSSEESGSGFFGAFTGYIVIIGLSIWLLYSANKKKQSPKDFKVLSNDNYSKDNISSLRELREKDILTAKEYEEKLEKIQMVEFEETLKKSDEYSKLKSLHENGILSKSEFEEKIILLKNMLTSISEGETENELDEYDFRIVEELSDDYYLIMNNDLDYGYADKNKNIVIDIIYEYAESFKDGIALVRKNGKFGFIDRKNNIVIQLDYEKATRGDDNIVKVENNGKLDTIDLNNIA